MSPEREKAGLLPGRPHEDGVKVEQDHEIDDVMSAPMGTVRSRRRPADIYVPHAVGAAPVALDFACTSGLQVGRLRDVTQNPDCIVTDYEDYKRNFKPMGESETTAELCHNQGFGFIPMVIEAHGGGW
eukprot:7514311-Karenia_brevis.AAC.1